MGMAQQLNYVVVEPLYFSSALKKGGKKTEGGVIIWYGRLVRYTDLVLLHPY